MIKWHINLNERTGIMKKKNSGLPKPFFKDKGETGLKEKDHKRSKNYAAIASVNREHYKLIREDGNFISMLGIGHLIYTLFCADFYNINPFDSIESFLFVTIPSLIIGILFIGLFPDVEIVENVDKARKFLLETGQEDTYENVNVIVRRYRKGRAENGWKKIEDMLYEDRKVPAFENVKDILRSSATGKLNEAVPAK
jgi:hypothetical protein